VQVVKLEAKSNYAKIQFCDQQVHFASLQFGCQNCEMQVFKKLTIAKLSAACFLVMMIPHFVTTINLETGLGNCVTI
jgi:hypothetical protein